MHLACKARNMQTYAVVTQTLELTIGKRVATRFPHLVLKIEGASLQAAGHRNHQNAMNKGDAVETPLPL